MEANGDCDKPEHAGFAENECAATCGFCEAESDSKGECQDDPKLGSSHAGKAKDCGGENSEFMHAHCPAACGLCEPSAMMIPSLLLIAVVGCSSAGMTSRPHIARLVAAFAKTQACARMFPCMPAGNVVIGWLMVSAILCMVGVSG